MVCYTICFLHESLASTSPALSGCMYCIWSSVHYSVKIPTCIWEALEQCSLFCWNSNTFTGIYILHSLALFPGSHHFKLVWSTYIIWTTLCVADFNECTSVQDVVTDIPYLNCLLCEQCWGLWGVGREGCCGAQLQAPHCWGVGKWLVMTLGGGVNPHCVLEKWVSNSLRKWWPEVNVIYVSEERASWRG